MKKPGKCVHFTGIRWGLVAGADEGTCKAGVSYAAIRKKSDPPALPCLPVSSGPTPKMCDLYKEPTAEQLAADEAALQARLDKLTENAKAGVCNDCEQKITAVRQVGRCVYAEPCGHRIGQGDAKQVRKAMGL